MKQYPLSHADALAYILAGNSTVTFENPETGNRFTYRVKAADLKPGESHPGVFFVSLLRGPSNESDYSYMGIIPFGAHQMRGTAKSKVGPEAPSFKAFNWVLKHLTAKMLPAYIRIWHEGTCGRCGRKLTVPESIASGLGPECEGRVRMRSPNSEPSLNLVGV